MPIWAGPRRALAVSLEQVQKELSQECVLVEFIKYERRNKNDFADAYGAVVITQDKASWVPLAEAKTIDSAIRRYRRKSQRGTSTLAGLKKLYGLVWEPLEAEIPSGSQTVILSPDGSLNFLSFATLVTPAGALSRRGLRAGLRHQR